MDSSLRAVFDLSPEEKLKLIDELWDDLHSTHGAVGLHESQIAELDRRKAEFQQNPGSGLSWEEVKRQVRAENGR
jgi:putative addiction module component (TIGR02574 family)